jgi:catechol 2,3-dioxygenase-like lactoylglutathione lyase family enzyme
MKLNHTIVPARNKQEAARFFADVFGLVVGSENPGTAGGRTQRKWKAGAAFTSAPLTATTLNC